MENKPDQEVSNTTPTVDQPEAPFTKDNSVYLPNMSSDSSAPVVSLPPGVLITSEPSKVPEVEDHRSFLDKLLRRKPKSPTLR